MPPKVIFFLCAVFATISLANTTANNDGPKHKTKRNSNADSMEEMGSFPLHSYMKQIYHKRARGNGNGSFTVSLRNQKILATSIRGFEPEKNGRFAVALIVVFKCFRILLFSTRKVYQASVISIELLTLQFIDNRFC